MKSAGELVDFFVRTSSLKRTLRYESCVPEIRETTASHSWLVTFMVPILADFFDIDIDVTRAMELANVHDLPEYDMNFDFDAYLVYTGDLRKEDKEKAELDAMIKIRDGFDFGGRLYDLWIEYEENKTREAKFVKALDKLESHIHFIDRSGFGDDQEDAYQITYADESVRNFPELKPFLKFLKVRIRAIVEERGVVWREEFDYPE